MRGGSRLLALPTWSLSPHPHPPTPRPRPGPSKLARSRSSRALLSSLAANHHPLFCFFLTSPNEAHHLVPEEAADRSQSQDHHHRGHLPGALADVVLPPRPHLILILTPLGHHSNDPVGRIGQRDRHPNQKQVPSRLILSLRRLEKGPSRCSHSLSRQRSAARCLEPTTSSTCCWNIAQLALVRFLIRAATVSR